MTARTSPMSRSRCARCCFWAAARSLSPCWPITFRPASALGWRHLAADLAGGIGLGVDVDVPVAGFELVRLGRGQFRPALDRALYRLAFGAEPDHHRPVLALRAVMEMRHGDRTGQ